MLVSWWILNGSQDFYHTLSLALCHKWVVKNDFAYVLQFLSLTSDGVGSVYRDKLIISRFTFFCVGSLDLKF